MSGRLRMGRSERGITIPEFMITMALVAILGSIAIPAMTGYVERARTNRAIDEIGRVSIGLYKRRTNNGGAFPPSLEAAGIQLDADPWGHAYTYVRVAGANKADLREDKNLNPINSDFDLYSVGPDGETARNLSAKKARDDVVRANNGAFVGIADDY